MTRDIRHVKAWLLIMLISLSLSWLTGCQSVPTAPSTPSYAKPQPAAQDARTELLRIAAAQIGAPYRYGGNTQRGFDCSGLVQYTHSRIGVDVPRTTRQQWVHARAPDRRHLIPGDLVFFALDGNKTRHVGIYEGGGVFIHAPSSGKRVSRASLDNPFWQKRMIGARTFL